jgi:hypothetical protein
MHTQVFKGMRREFDAEMKEEKGLITCVCGY